MAVPRLPCTTRLLAIGSFLVGGCLACRAADAQDILSEKSYWRVYVTWKTPTLVDQDGKVKPLYGGKTQQALKVVVSPPPPAKWMAPEFDDSGWAKSRGTYRLGAGYGGKLTSVGGHAELSGVYLRGRFHVTDPKRVRMMKLYASYVGGAVVYVNGQELQRGHLSVLNRTKGPPGPGTLGDPYPLRQYLRPDGKLLHELSDNKRRSLVEKEWLGRFKDRVRNLPPKGWISAVAVPSPMLRKGTNVVALANYAAPHNEVRVTGKFGRLNYRGLPSPWAHVGVHSVRLHCAPGPAVTANTGRPAGVQVWNRRIMQRVSAADWGDPCEPLRPIRLVGVRNGVFSGQVVLGTTELIEGLKTAASALKGPDGAEIPAANVRVRFAYTDRYYLRNAFDPLFTDPPKELEPPQNGAVNQPMWVTVSVPKDAAPGDYTGALKIDADAGMDPVEVAVQLKVIDWAMPEPKAFATHIELVQSPETLAHEYKTALWSDEHWKLIDRSFKLTGQVGNKVIHIPVISRTYFGNEHSRVRWIKQGGGYTHDFSLVEKYLDAAVKHLGKIPVVNIYCRDHNTGSYYFGKKETSKPKGMPYTELDPKTGTLTEQIGPKWGEPACRAFWKPVMDGLYAILKERGLEQSFMVGISGDKMPSQKCVDDLKAVAPYAKWVIASHANRTTLHGQKTGYVTDVWSSAGLPPSPESRWKKNRLGWNDRRIRVPFPRAGGHRFVGPSLRVGTDLGAYRRGPEGAILSGVRGYGRCGADFWPVFKKDWRYRGILARYPATAGWHGGSLVNSYPYILAPGPDGPIATVRLEVLREGVQVNEARIFIEKALASGALKEKVLAARCRALLDARCYRVLRGRGASTLARSYYVCGTEEEMEKLFSAAAEVAAALK